MRIVELHVNGSTRRVEVDAERSLLSVLRDELELTGAKYGCGAGQCGACTVLVAGRPVRACVVAVHTVAGQPITTIEGLEQQGRLHPVQEAFLATNALQCGYCTPGMIMAGVGLLQRHPQPTAADIRHALEGHICRCGTYPRIVAAMQQAAQRVQTAPGGGQ
jgi:aerobic-type carbon monoxide dehydrogenase small subunit (CoxS/CutS family)